MRLFVLIAMAGACGSQHKAGSEVEQTPPTRVVAREPGPAEDGLEVEGLKGRLSTEAIERRLASDQQRLDDCYENNLDDSRFLAGRITLDFAVAADGSVKNVELTSSDLGSWRVEKCLLDVARGMRFDQPEGGQAEFSMPLEFDNARSPVVIWEPERLATRLPKLDKRLRGCSGLGKERRAQVTVYLGRRGKVRSVGFAGPTVTDEWKDCAEQVISKEVLVDPRGALVKVSFWVPPG